MAQMAERRDAIRVLLAEDHQVVREGLRALLGQERDIAVVAEARDGLAVEGQVAEERPDVVVLDIGLPRLNGIEVTRRLRERHPEVRVLILSMYDDAQTADQALRAGARGYVLKGVGVADLCQAIRRVHRGEVYLSPQIAEFVLQGYLTTKGAPETDPLSQREREILQLIVEGFTARQIAGRLGLSPKTVENHRANIMDKLGIHTIAGLVRHAMRRGLVR
jgi:two-component system, NarL family, response regulator NreC